MGFLTERELTIRYKGKQSGTKRLPGGGPQGTILGLFLFLILINDAGYKNLEKNIGKIITVKKNKRKLIQNTHVKYVDDMTLAVALNLRKSLEPNPDVNLPFPLNYHDRTQQVLPDSKNVMQEDLNRIIQYCQDNNMRINQEKTKVVLFNTARANDFMPNLSILENHNLEVVEEFKLLGVIFQSNLRWQANTGFLCQKAYSHLWMLRLKSFGADQESILDVYHKQVRCVFELNVAVWEPGLNQAQIKQLERVQKCAFYVIMGDQYFDYESAVKSLKSDKLSDRRIKLCLKFAKKCEKSTKFNNWFEPAEIIT